jgi:hypothetical protein
LETSLPKCPNNALNILKGVYYYALGYYTGPSFYINPLSKHYQVAMQ